VAILVSKFQRRDSADRAAVGVAAFQLCKTQRAVPGITASRFFWTSADDIAILVEAESAVAFDEAPKPELAAAMFSLADLAQQTASERWIDPRDGMSTYQIAGR
jgi:hypothetical protein